MILCRKLLIVEILVCFEHNSQKLVYLYITLAYLFNFN